MLAACDICWLCGHAGADTVDHVIPLRVLKQTGQMELANDPTNLRPAHLTCNSRRQDRPPTIEAKRSRLW